MLDARACLSIALGVALSGCGGRQEPADQPPPAPLDLAGARVMIVPARAGEPRELDAEVVFWVTERSPSTDWVHPDELEEVMASIPSRFALDAPRRIIEGQRDQDRLADPLYGDLRRLGAFVEAQLALVPMGTRVHTDSTGVTVELTAVLASIYGGRVLWIHTVRGGPAETMAAGVSDAAEALARTLIRDGR
jgi:hypothetical protein